MPTIVYKLEGETDDFQSEMARVDSVLRRVETSGDSASKKVDKLGTTSAKTGTKAKRATTILEAFKQAAEGVGGKTGESAGKVEKFGRAFTLLGPAGPVAAATAVVAAFGAAGVVAALKTSKLVTELEKAGRTDVITQQQLGTVKDMDREIQLLTLDIKEATVQLGAQFAPAVLTLVTYARQGADAFAAWQDSTRWLWEGGEALRGMVSLRFLWGGVVEETQRAAAEARGYRSLLTGFAFGGNGGPATAVSPTTPAKTRGTGRSTEIAKADALARKALAANERARALAAALEGEDERREAARIKAIQDRMVAQQQLGQQLARQREEEAAAHQAAMQEAQQLADTRRSAQLSAASSIASSIQQLAAQQAQVDSEATERAKKRALVAFRISQGAAIAQIAINTAQAIMQGYAQLGPVAGNFAAIGTTATGAVQSALVLAQAPPSFDQGGMARDRMAPDHQLAALKRNEGVLTPTGVAAVGGEQGVNALNQGRQGNSDRPAYLMLDHRIYTAMTRQSIEMGGPVAEHVRETTEPPGQTLVGA